MNAQDLLQEIADYCRHSGLAESTFGRRAVNDGKLTARLRNGGRITTETLDRIRGFMETNRSAVARPSSSASIHTRTRHEGPANRDAHSVRHAFTPGTPTAAGPIRKTWLELPEKSTSIASMSPPMPLGTAT